MTPGYFSIPHSTPRFSFMCSTLYCETHPRPLSLEDQQQQQHTYGRALLLHTCETAHIEREGRKCARDSKKNIYKNGLRVSERTTKW